MENLVHVVDSYNSSRVHVFRLSDASVLEYNQATVNAGVISDPINEKWSRWNDVGYDDQIDGEKALGIRKFLEVSVPLLKRIKKAKAVAYKEISTYSNVVFSRGWSVRYMDGSSPKVVYEGSGSITKTKLKEALEMVPTGNAWVEGGYTGYETYSEDMDPMGIEYWEVDFNKSDLKRGA